ncbi:serine/threonine-protein kinase [Azospirillum sp. TSO35-2]|uniref:serine/threonine-protein kinase n=1 Tax=Azospirillum sp. TSO35-2 TaxID=716796 RepID=UPI000D6536EB|nr:serine/threonine-protein kinase [Azospirillum sp. TSO35-2]
MAQTPADPSEPTALPPAAGPQTTDQEATRLTAPPVTASSLSGVEAARGTPAPIGPGTLLSHTYLVEGLIARGGMGEVHRARHIDMNTWHAVKVIRPELAQDAKMVELLRREAAALRDIRHEAVVAYDGVFRDEYGRLLLSMEFLDGPSLQEVMQAGPLDAGSVAILLDRIASGLAAAHQRGIIHRDMSADNVILPGRRIADAKIIDFGIAKQTAAGAGTVIGDAFAGKYGYASPEQFGLFGGQVGPQSDIYSAGLVLAAVALGRPLDMGRTPQAMIERRMTVPDLSALDEPLRGVLRSMLEPDPQARVKTMAELVGALTHRPPDITPFEATPFPAVTPPPPPADTPKPARDAAVPAGPKKKTPVGLIAAAGVGVAAAGVAGFVLFGQPSPAPAPVPAPTSTTTATTTAGTAAITGTTTAATPPAPAPAAVPPPATEVASTPPGPAPAVTPPPVQPPAPPQVVPPAAAPPPAPEVAPVVPTAPPTPAPGPSLADARRTLEAGTGRFACAGLRTVEDGASGLRITGYVGKDDDAQALRTLIAGLPAGIDVSARVDLRPWPLCEALGVAGLPGSADGIDGGSLGLAFNRPSLVYRKGDKLEVNVTAGATGGYLTVDYFDIEGNVIHMLPMPLRRDNRLALGDSAKSITLGVAKSSSDRVYTITPPYGPAMILALVTRDPLFAAERPEVEPAGGYLAALRAALPKDKPGDKPTGYDARSAFFTTVAE